MVSQTIPDIARAANGLPISGEGPYAMVDSTTAGAARRPSFIL
jgi:hypothetical protein